ncbi:MAG: hypothetical protein ABI067_17825 [Leifsonia sp.]
MTARNILIAFYFAGIALVLAGAVLSSVPIFLIGAFTAIGMFGLACIATDHTHPKGTK